MRISSVTDFRRLASTWGLWGDNVGVWWLQTRILLICCPLVSPKQKITISVQKNKIFKTCVLNVHATSWNCRKTNFQLERRGPLIRSLDIEMKNWSDEWKVNSDWKIHTFDVSPTEVISHWPNRKQTPTFVRVKKQRFSVDQCWHDEVLPRHGVIFYDSDSHLRPDAKQEKNEHNIYKNEEKIRLT
jgi:hypothetical protein